MDRPNSYRTGVVMGIAAYACWGLLPIYLKALQPIGAISILAYRISWSLLFMGLLALAMRRGKHIAEICRQPRLLLMLVVSSLLIGVNWAVYIWAVNNGHVLQASLGYFINPLLNVLLGVLILRERLGRPEAAAIAIAATGVVALAIWQQALPIVPLVLALTFSFYGLVRKMIAVDAIEGLLIETVILTPIALYWLATHDGGTLPPAPHLSWLLVALSGIVTAVPLLLFTAAGKRIRYADLGLLQYISPTTQMSLAVLVYGEPLLPIHLFTFAMIWLGLAIYGTVSWRRGRATPPALPE